MRGENAQRAARQGTSSSGADTPRGLSRLSILTSQVRETRDKRKRDRAKAKASKQFDKTYGDEAAFANGGASSSKGRVFNRAQATDQPQAGPRAAVYKGEMGASQKRSSRLQAKEPSKSTSSGAAGARARVLRIPHKLGVALCALAVVALCGVMLYGPAQQYYQQLRETDRLQAEYAAVALRSETLQSSIESLQTEAGIEDKAHEDLGYVKAGEQTATVKGINYEDSSEFSSNVLPGSVPAPETWYSPFLDVVFDYSAGGTS